MFLHLDNRGEYLLTNITNYLKEHKIKWQLTCPNTPQQNGVPERKNRHLGEIRRIMLHDKNVSWRFWTKAMQTSAYVLIEFHHKDSNLCLFLDYFGMWNPL